MRRALLIMVVVFLPVSGAAGTQPKSIEVVGPTGEIPHKGFKTWSLFLVCNQDWVTQEESHDLAGLYHRFKRFGDAIGDDNLAVWFWKDRVPVDDSRLSDNVDVPRSARYCQELKLRPSAGPFLVVTSEYPRLKPFPRDRAVFELGGLGPADLSRLLLALTDQLLLEGKIDAERRAPAPIPGGVPGPRLASTSLWLRLLEGARHSMIGFGCKLKMRIETGVLSAELRECAGT